MGINFLTAIYLLWGTLQDVRTRTVSVLYLWIGTVLGFASVFFHSKENSLTIADLIFSLVPGMIFLLLGRSTREQVGYGDGWMLLILGMCLGSRIWRLWQLALILSAVFTVGMILLKKLQRTSRIPFLPFLWISHLLLWGMDYV